MSRGRGGFTLLEAVLAIAVLGILMGGFLRTFGSFSELQERSDAAYNAAVEASGAMAVIRRDLSRSGFVLVNGLDFPTTFPAGEPPASLSNFGHEKPHKMAKKGHAWGGGGPTGGETEDSDVAQEGVVVLPLDANGDGWPDVDASGDPIWDPDVVGFQLVPQPDGSNNLVRMRDSGTETILARRVREFMMESPADTAYAIPLDTLRVSLVVQRVAEDGTIHEQQLVEIVQLKNGGLGL